MLVVEPARCLARKTMYYGVASCLIRATKRFLTVSLEQRKRLAPRIVSVVFVLVCVSGVLRVGDDSRGCIQRTLMSARSLDIIHLRVGMLKLGTEKTMLHINHRERVTKIRTRT